MAITRSMTAGERIIKNRKLKQILLREETLQGTCGAPWQRNKNRAGQAHRKSYNGWWGGAEPTEELTPNCGTTERSYGNSTKLGRQRWNKKTTKKKKGIDYVGWRLGREAQHLIPAEVCKIYNISAELTNSVVNGMMLPSGRDGGKSTDSKGQLIAKVQHRNVDLDKEKPWHIEHSGCHADYNTYVKQLVQRKGWKEDNVSDEMFVDMARHLRGVHIDTKKVKGDESQMYVNQLPIWVSTSFIEERIASNMKKTNLQNWQIQMSKNMPSKESSATERKKILAQRSETRIQGVKQKRMERKGARH